MCSVTPYNPFPTDAVVKTSIEQLPDFETECYRKAVTRIESFRENFSLPTSPGLAMGIRGSFGSGKTHLVFQLMRELQVTAKLHSISIYAKAEKADFLDLYVNHFAGKLDVDVLRKAVSLHLAKLLRGSSAAVSGTSSGEGSKITIGELMRRSESEQSLVEIAKKEVDKLAATDPASILSLVQQDLLPVSGLSQELDREIEKTARTKPDRKLEGQTSTTNIADVSADFFRAYSKVTDKNLGTTAVRWIQGGTLTNAEKQDLGLQSEAITQTTAKQALRFLLSAFKKADFAVMFCLDEFERFHSGKSTNEATPAEVSATAILLKDLTETFQETGHFLLISGENGAWDTLRTDVFARIKPADIIEMALSEKEGRGLLDAYCRSSQTSVDYLFQASSFSLLYEASNHNTRRLLELAHECYEIAASPLTVASLPAPPTIKDGHVEQAANNLLSSANRRAKANSAIERIALNMGLSFRSDLLSGGIRCDYVIGGLQPNVVINVTQSIFKLSEVSAAREIAAASQTIHEQYPGARFCVVIVGYSTQEVRSSLAKVVDRVFAYDEERFRVEFAEFLRGVVSQPSPVEETLKTQADAYKELAVKFDELEKTRRDEIDRLKEALDDLKSQSVRARETERDKRVSDKMDETLDELRRLLEREERLAFRRLAENEPDAFVHPAVKLEVVFRLLDDERAHIRRAEILSDVLPQREEFSRLLDRLLELLLRTGELWRRLEGSYGQLFLDEHQSPGLYDNPRDLYRERKEILNELEALNYKRALRGTGALVRFGHWVRQNKILMILACLSFLGIAVALYSLYSSWTNEGNAITYCSVELMQIRSQVQLMQYSPETVVSRGESIADGMLSIVVSLDNIPLGKTYLVSEIVTARTKDLRDHVLSLKNEARPHPSPSPSPTSSFQTGAGAIPAASPSPSAAIKQAKLMDELQNIDGICGQLQRDLSALSYSRFALKYFAGNIFWAVLEFTPVFALMIYLLFRRWRRVARRRFV